MTVGQRIRARREELGLSVIELAERLGKARSTVYRYESDDIQDMPITVLEPLAEALCTTPAYLMGWSDDPIDYENYDLTEVNTEIVRHFNGDARQIHAFLKARDEDAQQAREELADDPNRKALLNLARYGSAQDVKQVAALIDALRATNPDFYDGDDPS